MHNALGFIENNVEKCTTMTSEFVDCYDVVLCGFVCVWVVVVVVVCVLMRVVLLNPMEQHTHTLQVIL